MRERGSTSTKLGLLACALAGWAIVFPARAVAGPTPDATCASSCSSASSCTFDGVKNVALGQARLSVNSACHLVVDNIGSSAEDGFSQEALTSEAFEVATHLACPNFANSKQGDKEVVTFYADVPGGVFYTMTVENIGNRMMEMRPDFSAIGATLFTVTILNDGKTVREIRDLPSGTFRMAQADQEEIN